MKDKKPTMLNKIQDRIYTIRGVQVMLDSDLAELYQVETKRVNEAVKNNLDKFPQDFYFELTNKEFIDLRSKISTTNFSKVRTNPKVFTEKDFGKKWFAFSKFDKEAVGVLNRLRK